MSKLSLITMTSSLHKEQKDVVVWRGEVKTKLSVYYAEGPRVISFEVDPQKNDSSFLIGSTVDTCLPTSVESALNNQDYSEKLFPSVEKPFYDGTIRGVGYLTFQRTFDGCHCYRLTALTNIPFDFDIEKDWSGILQGHRGMITPFSQRQDCPQPLTGTEN
jgi:hypothetical protein